MTCEQCTKMTDAVDKAEALGFLPAADAEALRGLFDGSHPGTERRVTDAERGSWRLLMKSGVTLPHDPHNV